MKLEFSCGGKVVGAFVDVEKFPDAPGRVRYMPYRGPGHLLLQEECARSGSARCSYVTAAGTVDFTARGRGAYRPRDIHEITPRGAAAAATTACSISMKTTPAAPRRQNERRVVRAGVVGRLGSPGSVLC